MEIHRPVDKRLLSLILSERLPDSDWHSLSPTDWESIVHLAITEGAGPLLYAELSRARRVGLLPEPLQASLRALYFSIRMKNEQTIQELGALTALLAQAGIPVVALKGACFALTIYPDTGVRPMADLDLLVPAPNHSEALRLVQALGYEAALPEASPGLDALLNHAVCLKKHTMPFTVLELHTTLVAEESFTHAVPVDWFWSQTEPLKSPGGRDVHPHLLMLTPTAQLLYACAHAMLQHGGRNTSLHWLYDLDRLVRVYADRLDWDLFLSQARAFEWSSAALAAFSEAVLLFETPVPPAVLDRLSHTSDRNAERVAALRSAPATHTLEEYQKLQALNWTGKVRLILALVIPGPDYMRWRYGLKSSWALPGWYLYRWWEILKDALKTMLLVTRKAILETQPKNGGTLERSTHKSQP